MLLSIPMNIPHIVPNPYMPPAVRGVHFIETASSTFIFGMLMFGLLYRAHRLAPDLFGILPSRKGLTIEQLCDIDS